MPIHAIEHVFDAADPPVEIGVKLYGMPDGTDLTFLYSDIPGSSWTAPRIALAQQYVQDNIDVRIDRASLPADHPYIKDGDPALTWLFWDGTDVVERLLTFTDLAFDGDQSTSTFLVNRINRRLEPL